MKVLLLGPCPPPEGGVSQNLFAIRNRLLSSGHECKVISVTSNNEEKDEPNIFYPKTPMEFLHLLRRLDFDVLHLHVGGNIPGRVLGLMFTCAVHSRKRSILTLHSGGFASESIERAKKLSSSGTVFRMFERVICVNPLMAQMFERFGVPGERLRVIPAFSFEAQDPTTPLPQHIQKILEKYDPLLLTVGQLEQEYDLESQIEAFRTISSQFSRAGLIIVGSGSEESNLRDLVVSKGLSERVYLAGNVEHRHVLNLISRANVLLRTTKYDGDAISVREALHLGTPVIATQNEMRPDGVELITMPANPGELAAKTKDVLARKLFRRPLSLEGINDNIDSVIGLYKELVNG